MASIDVNEVMTDPALSTTFDVRRQQEMVNAQGRAVIVNTTFEDVRGIITWLEGPINQGDDATLATQAINIATPFSLRDASFGFQPDVIVWNGAEYRITSIKAHRHLGPGWTRATAASTRASDNPPPEGNMP